MCESVWERAKERGELLEGEHSLLGLRPRREVVEALVLLDHDHVDEDVGEDVDGGREAEPPNRPRTPPA